jgi:hypothetical protein
LAPRRITITSPTDLRVTSGFNVSKRRTIGSRVCVFRLLTSAREASTRFVRRPMRSLVTNGFAFRSRRRASTTGRSKRFASRAT